MHAHSVTQSYPTLWPHRLQPTRLHCLWDYPGKNTGVGCHLLLQGIFPAQGLNMHIPSSPGPEGGFFTTTPRKPTIEPVCICVLYLSLMSDSLQLHGLQPTRLSMEFSRQEHWSRLPFPLPSRLRDWTSSLASPALAGWFFTTALCGKPHNRTQHPTNIQNSFFQDHKEHLKLIICWQKSKSLEFLNI